MELTYPCGHAITVDSNDTRFIFGRQEAMLVANTVLYCRECWIQDGKAIWKEPGDYFAYREPHHEVAVANPEGVVSMLIYAHLDQIDDNPFQARQEYGDMPDLAERIASARASYPDGLGLMQIPRGRVIFCNATMPDGKVISIANVIATMTGKDRILLPDTAVRVQLAFGHRRLRAFRHLHDTGAPGYERGVFPLYIGELNDQQMLDAVWAENSQRKDISAIEEAELLAKKLAQVQASGGSQRDVAEAWGLARPTISNKLRLLQLPDDVKAANRTGRISERVASDILRVVELQTAVNGADWNKIGNQWVHVQSPTEYIEDALKDNDLTSVDVRQYMDKALRYAGSNLPKSIAGHAFAAANIRQETCKNCPARVNNKCLDKACLDVKKEIFAEDMVNYAASDLGLDTSFDEEDFVSFYHSNNAQTALEFAWSRRDKYKMVGFVVGWQEGGSAVRPYREPNEGSYINNYNDGQFDNNGLAGIVIGVRGGALPPYVLEEILADQKNKKSAAIIEDIASDEMVQAWNKESTKIRQKVEKQAKALLADALYMDISSSERLQAMIFSPETKEIDSHEKFVGELVKFLWAKGNGRGTAYSELETVEQMENLLSRAGISPVDLFANESSKTRLTRNSVMLLDYWYRRREWTGRDTRENVHRRITSLLAIWTTEEDEELQALRQELERALREIKRKDDKAKADLEAIEKELVTA